MSMPAYSFNRRLAVPFMGVLVSNRGMAGGGSKLGTKVHITILDIPLCAWKYRAGIVIWKARPVLGVCNISEAVLPSCGYVQYDTITSSDSLCEKVCHSDSDIKSCYFLPWLNLIGVQKFLFLCELLNLGMKPLGLKSSCGSALGKMKQWQFEILFL